MVNGRWRPKRRMKSLYRIIQWSPSVMAERPNRRLDGITERKLSFQLKAQGGLELGRKQREKTKQLRVGVDLHKNQFTICAMYGDGELVQEGEYRTTAEGYQEFMQKMHEWEDELGCLIALAVETTGNARFFKNRMEAEGF